MTEFTRWTEIFGAEVFAKIQYTFEPGKPSTHDCPRSDDTIDEWHIFFAPEVSDPNAVDAHVPLNDWVNADRLLDNKDLSGEIEAMCWENQDEL